MTISEEIEQLKTQLEKTTDAKEQAEVLLKMLDNYTFLKSSEGDCYLEQLKQTAEALKSDEYRAWVFYYTAINHVYAANYSAATEIVEKAIHLFAALHHPYGLALAHNAMGLNYFNQHNYPLALEHYLHTANIAEEAGEKSILSRAYNNIGNIYYQQGDYPAALEHHLKALNLREETGDKTPLASSYANLGNVYASQSNYSLAIEYYAKAIKIREETEDKAGLTVVYNNLGSICMFQGDYAKALEYILKGLKFREEAGDKTALSDSYGSIGNIYILQSNYPLAFEYFLKALKCREETDDKKGLAHCYVNLGDYYFRVKEFDTASVYLKDALKMFEEIGVREGKREALQLLYELNKAKGDVAAALRYYEDCVAIEKEMNNIETAQKIAAMQLSRQLEQKEKEMQTERLHHIELKAEKERSESLLLNILPAEVAEELKQKGTAEAKLFDNVTVLFSDFASFTSVSERLSPQQLVDELHTCFSAFDEIITKHRIEKIKTVGDAYLAVSGLPHANPNHAVDIIKAGIEMRDFMIARKVATHTETFEVRIGIHSGSVVAGIVGVKKFAYDIWGDTVNTAARMEQNSEAGKINISQATYELVKDTFNCKYRGEIEAKHKGKLKMYFVEV